MSGPESVRQPPAGTDPGSLQPPRSTRRDNSFQIMARAKKTDSPGFPAISIRQPNADRIIRGERHRDTRSRPTHFRGWLLLHASRTFRRKEAARGEEDLERGKLLGIVQLEDCVKDGSDWAYVWKSPRRFRQPIACRGHYSIPFYVPKKLVAGTPAAKVTPGKLEGEIRRRAPHESELSRTLLRSSDPSRRSG